MKIDCKVTYYIGDFITISYLKCTLPILKKQIFDFKFLGAK